MRKQRDGVSGFELPFTAHMIETGVDSDGDPITSPPVIEWAAPGQVTTSNADALWTPSMQLLRRILTTALAESGKPVRPRLDGPEVVACESELVRAEFYRQYPVTDGNEKQKADARRQAFNRQLKDCVSRDLVATREVSGRDLIWLTRTETRK